MADLAILPAASGIYFAEDLETTNIRKDPESKSSWGEIEMFRIYWQKMRNIERICGKIWKIMTRISFGTECIKTAKIVIRFLWPATILKICTIPDLPGYMIWLLTIESPVVMLVWWHSKTHLFKNPTHFLSLHKQIVGLCWCNLDFLKASFITLSYFQSWLVYNYYVDE